MRSPWRQSAVPLTAWCRTCTAFGSTKPSSAWQASPLAPSSSATYAHAPAAAYDHCGFGPTQGVCAQLCCSSTEHLNTTTHQHTIQAAGMKSVWKKDQVTTFGCCSSSSSRNRHTCLGLCACQAASHTSGCPVTHHDQCARDDPSSIAPQEGQLQSQSFERQHMAVSCTPPSRI